MPYTVHHKISNLVLKHLGGELTGEERTVLDEWIASSPENKALYEELTTEEILAANVKDIDVIKSRIAATINRQVPGIIETGHSSTAFRTGSGHNGDTKTKVRRMWVRWVAAAAIIVMIVGGWWMIEGKRQGVKGEREVATTHDVPAPTNTRAVITLADGSKVYLDSAGNGTIAQQNDVAVVKDANGGIKYLSPAGGGAGGMSPSGGGAQRAGEDYNTLFNPRGSKVISLTLSDGTKVWLNSESSLRYPASFVSNTREVEITGEAYFKVKHNAKQPFKVHLPNGSIVEDIGTSFNINAYSDEEATKTTLIEGAVKISAPSANTSASSAFLKPGNQAVQNPNNPVIRVQNDINISQILSWKENKFFFDGADIQTIARQLSRWYDVDVEIKDNIPSHFTGIISRDVNVSQVFDMLQKTGAVHFSVEGKKIVVTK
jgi:ferric-dicitrate binding protein FerR (iron transport regulator)